MGHYCVYDTTDWHEEWGLRTAPFYPEHLALSPDGQLVAITGGVGATSQIVVVDLRRHEVVRTIEPGASVVAWSPDGSRLVGGGGLNAITIYDVRSGEVIEMEDAENGRAIVRYTPDGKYLIESIYNRVKIWDGQHRVRYQEIRAMPGSLAVSSDGRYLAMGGNKKVIVWKLK